MSPSVEPSTEPCAYLSASRHLDLGHFLRSVGEQIYVHVEPNEEVLLCRLQEVFQEHDVSVQKVTRANQTCCVQGSVVTSTFSHKTYFPTAKTVAAMLMF